MNKFADDITRAITMLDICSMYGYEPSRAGYICCPFHNEKTPSLKVYPGSGGWHCFGCGAGGSVIDFVMQLFNISFHQAIIRINDDFSLGLALSGKRDSKELRELAEKRREKKQRADEAREKYNALAARHRELVEIIKKKAPASADEQPCAEFIHALRLQPYIEHLLDTFDFRGEEIGSNTDVHS